MINVDDYKNKDGNTDWKAYEDAQVKAGVKCSKCKSYMFGGKNGSVLCSNCYEIKNNIKEVIHERLIRCPKCNCTWSPFGYCDGELLEDGEHSVDCPYCDFEFTLTTDITHSFVSPEKLGGGK